MKKFKRTMVILFAVILMISNNLVYANGLKSTNPLNYKRDTEERYIASIALEKGITFEEAENINKKEVDLILKSNSNGIFPMARDEVIKYKTVDKRAGVINSNVGSRNVYIATEVRYLYSNVSNKPLYIENIGNPLIYISGISYVDISGGGFNIEKYSTTARISNTVSFEYRVNSSIGITSGLDILQVSGQAGGEVQVTTRAKTYVINISLSDL